MAVTAEQRIELANLLEAEYKRQKAFPVLNDQYLVDLVLMSVVERRAHVKALLAARKAAALTAKVNTDVNATAIKTALDQEIVVINGADAEI